ncbi:MAG: B12-binding domain-containing radical SAM protein [Candidatus Omnitrophica bacterium]|nr:B12-binding domain-containing radical SAM protein [Candidatus Omnitrophota bacterium]
MINSLLDGVKPQDIRVAFVHDLTFNEPIGIGYLAAYIKKHFPLVKVALFDPKVDPISSIADFQPTLVLYSIMTGQQKQYIERNIRIKKLLKPFISVFGGAHPTYFPEMVTEEGVDIICRGEGEKPLGNLIQAMVSHSDIRFIKGLWVKYDDKIHRNEVDLLIDDLSALPFPDRDIYYGKSSFLRTYGRKPVVGARGCPFKCSYCYNSGLNALFAGKGKVFRSRSPQSVVSEVKAIKSKFNLRFIAFIEDVFSGIDIEWLKAFQAEYSKLDIPFFVSLRAEFVNSRLAKYLRKSGCVSASMAIEHGEYEYRKKYLFRNMSNDMLIEGTRILESEGIRVASPVMLGLPFSDLNSDIETLRLVSKTRPTHATTAVFQPYPGTALTNMCLEKKLLEAVDVDNLQDDFYSPAPLKGVDYKKVLKLHNSFSVILLINRWFKTDVGKCFKRLPDLSIIGLVNVFLKYLSFRKIISYRRSLIEIIREIYNALSSGVFGVGAKRKREPSW